MTVSAIILAAGSSSRMGESKQMLTINGQRLLVRTIQTVLDSGIQDVVVVLGSDESIHRKAIGNLPVDTTFNDEWENGMGSSIKHGLLHVTSRHPVPEAVIILVCDQPLLGHRHLQALVAKYQQAAKPIIASSYAQQPGVPVLFDHTCYERLLGLEDKEGAKKVILKNLSDVALVPFPGGEIDLDTMEDYQAFLKR